MHRDWTPVFDCRCDGLPTGCFDGSRGPKMLMAAGVFALILAAVIVTRSFEPFSFNHDVAWIPLLRGRDAGRGNSLHGHCRRKPPARILAFNGSGRGRAVAERATDLCFQSDAGCCGLGLMWVGLPRPPNGVR